MATTGCTGTLYLRRCIEHSTHDTSTKSQEPTQQT